MSDDLFSAGNSLKVDFQKWENIGDKVAGVLVERVHNTVPNKYGHLTEDYILVTDDGRKVCVQGRSYPKGATIGKDLKVIFGTEKLPLGAYVGFIYERDIPTSNGNPAKIVEVRYAGQQKPEVLAEYQSKFASGIGAVSEEETVTDQKQPQF